MCTVLAFCPTSFCAPRSIFFCMSMEKENLETTPNICKRQLLSSGTFILFAPLVWLSGGWVGFTFVLPNLLLPPTYLSPNWVLLYGLYPVLQFHLYTVPVACTQPFSLLHGLYISHSPCPMRLGSRTIPPYPFDRKRDCASDRHSCCEISCAVMSVELVLLL